VEESQRRIARNEAVFRRVNEALRTGRWPDAGTAGDAFRCECARLGCTRLIELTAAEYERIRAHPRRFLVAPGHELPEAENVVERGEGYIVVEKRGAAATVAEATDPRR
jgi:hypothetical protein